MEKNTGIRFAAGKPVLWFVILNRSLGQVDDTSGKTERYEFSQEQANALLDCDPREGKGEGGIFPSPASTLGEWRRLIGLFPGREPGGKKKERNQSSNAVGPAPRQSLSGHDLEASTFSSARLVTRTKSQALH